MIVENDEYASCSEIVQLANHVETPKKMFSLQVFMMHNM